MKPFSKQQPQYDGDMSEDELTDDEAYLERHSRFEAEEIKRYNIGLNKKDQ